MITRHVVLAKRIRHELTLLNLTVERCMWAMERITANPADQDLYMAAIALHLHDFYCGAERIFEMAATEVDANVPTGRAWHRDLLTQMTLTLPEIRPPVLTPETVQALDEYLRFRHIVRNVYAFQFEMGKLVPLVTQLEATQQRLARELETFTEFLLSLSRADE